MSELGADSVGQDIVALTNETYDRLRPQLDRYTLDERRATSRGGLILAGNISVIHDLEAGYGFMDIKISGAGSQVEVAKVHTAFEAERRDTTDETFRQEVLDGMRADERRVLGASIGFLLLRDRYPKGHTGARDSDGYMWGKADFDPSVWGERHRIGLRLGAVLQDGDGEPYRWKQTIALQNRFDRPVPQKKISTTTSKPVTGTSSEDRPTKFDRDEKSRRLRATTEDVALMTKLVHTARDIRPVVDRIRAHLAYEKIFKELAGSDREAA